MKCQRIGNKLFEVRKKVPHHLLDAEHKVDAINAIKVINKHPILVH